MIFNEVKVQPKARYNKFITIKFKEPVVTKDYINKENGMFMIDARETLGFQSPGRSEKEAIEKFGFDVFVSSGVLLNGRDDLSSVFEYMKDKLIEYVDIKALIDSTNEYLDFIKEKEKEKEQWIQRK